MIGRHKAEASAECLTVGDLGRGDGPHRVEPGANAR